MARSELRSATTLMVIGMMMGIIACRASSAQAPASDLPLDPQFGISTIPLWPANAPASVGSNASESNLTVFRPAGKGNGTAVIIAPGGAYLHLAMGLEGGEPASWFTARGVTAFVLKYRVGTEHLFPEPLYDAQRAVRLVRSTAGQYGIQSDNIGMMGFSAGGHLAATVATTANAGDPQSPDPVERFSDRPDFVVLGYPWLNAMEPQIGKLITYCSTHSNATAQQCARWGDQYDPQKLVSTTTPPVFIYSTTDDKTVPISASVEFYSALVKAGVPAEMHLFRHGNHGSGMGSGSDALDTWPALLEIWLRDQGFLTAAPAAAPAPATPAKPKVP